ncbi:MAG: anion permease [Candidatus Tectomicrobia bacterium]|uniref:Anion permease n=1 Tax=Tectimicrobiota bacterium TaxID=2528274 RepID=A0A932GQ41_UNCTE|nr:anion permease [Candidatus Tectomicrobia bacterium]
MTSPAQIPARKSLGAILGPAVALAVYFLPLTDMPPQARHAFAITLFATIYWLTEPIRVELTGLIALVALALSRTVPFEIAFSPFGSKSLWLVIAGLLMGLGVTHTRLGRRVAFRALLLFGRSYWTILLGLMASGFLFTFVVPSALVRILLLASVAQELCKALGYKPGTPAATGIFLAFGAATYFPGTGILTAQIPSIVVLGILEKLKITIYWGEWAVRMFPVMSLGGLVAIYLYLRMAVHDAEVKDTGEIRRDLEALGPMGAEEKRVLVLLALGIILWATDSLHHIHPTFVALGIGVALFLPGIGGCKFEDLSSVHFPILFFVGALFGIGEALQSTGFTRWISAAILGSVHLETFGWFGTYFTITLITALLNLPMNTLTQASVTTPIILSYAQERGINLVSSALSMVVSYNYPYIPYQSPPLVVLLSFGYVEHRELLRMMLFVGAVGIFVLTPLNLLYWRLFGFI